MHELPNTPTLTIQEEIFTFEILKVACNSVSMGNRSWRWYRRMGQRTCLIIKLIKIDTFPSSLRYNYRKVACHIKE